MAQVPTMNFLENRTFGVVEAGRGGTTMRFGSRWVTLPVDIFSMYSRDFTASSILPALAYQCGVSCMTKMRRTP